MRTPLLAMLAATITFGLTATAEARARGGFSRSSSRSTPAATPANPTSPAGPTAGSRGPSLIYLGGGRSSAAAAASTAAAVAVGASAAAAASPPRAKAAAAPEKLRDPCESDKVFGKGVGFCAVN